MLTALIILAIISIAIPSITLVAWVRYTEEIDMEFMSSLKITEETVAEPVVVTTVRRYDINYVDKLETEADKRMRQANSFYERGLVW